eukprot:GHVP01033405.1.p1 GENE.GHVP01033405.1~~GHVP01033405.1.p1  ORF type:complete len:1413 (-),score=219.83 GHVP01033405.1:3248-7486(-)
MELITPSNRGYRQKRRQHPTSPSSSEVGGTEKEGTEKACFGIPVVPKQKWPAWKPILFVLLSWISLGIFCYRNIISLAFYKRIYLPDIADVTIHASNCLVLFTHSPNNMTYVDVMYWKHRSSSRLKSTAYLATRSKGDNFRESLLLALHVKEYNHFWYCGATFYLTGHFVFDELELSLDQQADHMPIVAEVGIVANSININVAKIDLRLQSLAAKLIKIKTFKGKLEFKMSSPRDQYPYMSEEDNKSLELQTEPFVLILDSTPTYIWSRHSVKILMPTQVASRSLIRGHSVFAETATDLSVVYAVAHSNNDGELDYPIPIRLHKKTSPLYLYAGTHRDDTEPRSQWTGTHQLVKPHVMSGNGRLIQDAVKNVQQRTEPWKVRLNLLSSTTSANGKWKLLFGAAYLKYNIWFVPFSAALLVPRTIDLHMHIMGLYCRPELTTDSWDNDNTWKEGQQERFFLIPPIWRMREPTINLKKKETDILVFDNNDDANDDFNDDDPELESLTPFGQKIMHTNYPGAVLPDIYPSFTCPGPLLAWEFETIFGIFESVLRRDDKMVIWETPTSETKFTVSEDTVIATTTELFNESFEIVWASFISVIFALIVGFFVARFMYRNIKTEYAYWPLHTLPLLKTTTHRLQHSYTHPANQSNWNIHVTCVSYPNSEVLIRWQHHKRIRGVTGIRVRIIKEVFVERWLDSLIAKLEKIKKWNSNKFLDDICHLILFFLRYYQEPSTADRVAVFTVPYSEALLSKEATILSKKQLRLPQQYPHTSFPPLKDVQWQLYPTEIYRFQLSLVNSEGTVLLKSTVSDPTPGPDRANIMFELPNIILRKVIQPKHSALPIFIAKHITYSPPPPLKITFRKFYLIGRKKIEEKREATNVNISKPEFTRGEIVSDTVVMTHRVFLNRTSGNEDSEDSITLCKKNSINIFPKLVSSSEEQLCVEFPGTSELFIRKWANTGLRLDFKNLNGAPIASGVFSLENFVMLLTQAPKRTHGQTELPKIDERESSFYRRNFRIQCESSSNNKDWKWRACFEVDLGDFLPFVNHYPFVEDYEISNAPTLNSTETSQMEFTSSRIEDCQELPMFYDDKPRQEVSVGSDFVIKWVWPKKQTMQDPDEKENPSDVQNIYLHLISNKDRAYLHTLFGGNPIPNRGQITWVVEDQCVPPGQTTACVYFAMTKEKVNPDDDETFEPLAVSNSFIIFRFLTLVEFEFAFAAFCRSHGLEMQPLSEFALNSEGIPCLREKLHCTMDIRKPLPFEPQFGNIYTPGQYSICPKLEEEKKKPSLNRQVPSSEDNFYNAASEHVDTNSTQDETRTVVILENRILSPKSWQWEDPVSNLLLSHSTMLFSGALLSTIRNLRNPNRNFSQKPASFFWELQYFLLSCYPFTIHCVYLMHKYDSFLNFGFDGCPKLLVY